MGRRAERMSALEASFLALERPGLPMHVSAVVLIEAPSHRQPPLTLDDIHHLVASRLSRVPRFRQRVRTKPLGLARAEWLQVARTDLSGHLFHHRLPAPGRTSQLAALCGRIQEELLPRDRPLWQMHLVDGLEGGRQALIVKTHHSITDGIGGLELAAALLEPPRARARRSSKTLPIPHFATATASPNAWLQGLVGVAFTAASGPIALASPFNGWVGAHRAFAMATLSMERVREVKGRLGVSVDDVLLERDAGGLHRNVQHGRISAPRAMRAMFPASARPAPRKPQAGNHVTTVFVDLPLDSGDLSTCARKIAVSKALLKTVHAGLGMTMLIETAGRLPAPLHEAVVRVVGNLPVANLVLSDVPGPAEPQFLLGRRIVASYPMIPLPGMVGVSIAAISMGGTMGVGVISDPRLLPNPARLARAIEQAFESFKPAARHAEPGSAVHPRARRAA